LSSKHSINLLVLTLIFGFVGFLTDGAIARVKGCSFVRQYEEGNDYIDFHQTKYALRISNSINPDVTICEFDIDFDIRITSCTDEFSLKKGDLIFLSSNTDGNSFDYAGSNCADKLEIKSLDEYLNRSIYKLENTTTN